jgi:hypothetical protein
MASAPLVSIHTSTPKTMQAPACRLGKKRILTNFPLSVPDWFLFIGFDFGGLRSSFLWPFSDDVDSQSTHAGKLPGDRDFPA